jgi:hypothetical protein
MVKIIQNAFEYNDVIYNSTHVHDYVQTVDGKYFTDGGLEYIRRNFGSDNEECFDLALSEAHTLEEICNRMVWGTYGINGDQPLKWIRIRDMTTSHQMAVLENCKNIGALTKYVLQYWINQNERFKRMGIEYR